MASGTSGALVTSNQYINYTISIVENSISIENNTSNVTVSVRFYRTNSGYETYGSGTVYCTIDGSDYSASVTASQKITSSGIVLFTKTLDISHDSDGSKTLYVRAYISHSQVTSSSQLYGLVLSTIPRTSSISVGNGTLGSAMTITADSKSSSFTHTLTWACGNYSGTIATKSSETSWSFTPELKLSTGAPNGTSLYASFTLETYSGSTYVGSYTEYVWLAIPSSVVPSVTIELSDDKGYAATYGGYIQGKSEVKVVANGSGIYGSSISSYSTVVNGKTYSGSTATASLADKDGSVTVKTTVKDSRGRSASVSKSITVIAYSNPIVSKLSVVRCNLDGTENDRGAYTKVSFAYSITPLSNKNTKAAAIRYKKSSDTEWVTKVLTADYMVTNQHEIISTDDGSSYNIQLVVTDAFGSTTKSTSVSTGFCLQHITASGKGITFGGIAETEGFGVKMDATFEGVVDARKKIYMGGNKKTSDEKQIHFQTETSATNVHDIQIYGGNGGSVDAFGVYDSKNSRNVFSYDDSTNTAIAGPLTHFEHGMTEDIRIVSSGDCNDIRSSGHYYIGDSVVNKPSSENGWLTVKSYGTNYCYQEFMSNAGNRYLRMQDSTTWGAWIRSGYYGGPKLLWSGYAAMFASQTATLSEAVSMQQNGIVLTFAADDSSTDDPNTEFSSHFVPKGLIAQKLDRGHTFNVSSGWALGTKYLYINDTQVRGNDINQKGESVVGGATFNNAYFVLVRIYGV